MRGLNAVPGRLAADGVARLREAARQQQLLDSLFAPDVAQPHDALPGWSRGLAAYRANAASHASDTLRTQYPTVLAMLGAQAFDSLAAMHWRACPPTCGDLARFGEDFPDWVRRRQDLAAWPWLADSAALDQAAWHVQLAAPGRLSDADLRLLAGRDPDTLRLRLAGTTSLVLAGWAVVSLRELHAASVPDAQQIAQTLRGEAQTAWVWRQDFETRCIALDDAGARWIRALLKAPTLGAALAEADDDFDAGAWLTQAVRAGWLDGVDAVTTEECKA